MGRFVVFLALILWAICPSSAFAEKRVALVIGNGAYQNAPRLPNPTRDAEAVANLLRTKAGFQVVQAHDLKSQEFLLALRDFRRVAEDADIAVVFYAGHAIQLGEKNYMIAVDATLDDEDDAGYYHQGIALDLLLQTVWRAKRLRVVILDASRDNPFVHKVNVHGLPPPQPGLAKVSESALTNDGGGGDTLIAYATMADLVAEDGDGEHSPFTEALLKHLAEPGLDIRRMFGKVRDDVRQSTKGAQVPLYFGTLGGDEIALVPASSASVSQPPDEEAKQRAADAEAKRKVEEEKCTKRATPQAQIECLQDQIIAMQREIDLKVDKEKLGNIIDRRVQEALEPRLHQ